MEPITRKEQYINAIVNGGADYPSPSVTRIERYLAKIDGENVASPEPITRIEMYLAKIAGADVELPEPVTRIEMYLAKIAGMNISTPVPVTRTEEWLYEWLSGGGGGDPVYNTVSGNPVTFNAVAAPLQNLRVAFSPVQAGSGDPNPTNVRPISGWTGVSATVNGSAVPVSWETEAGTVYSGYVDLVSGELVATWSASTYTGSAQEDWQLETTGLYKVYRGGLATTTAADTSSVLSSFLPARSRSSIYGGSVSDGVCLQSGTHIWVRAGSVVSDLAGWTTYLGQHPLQVVYKLATPVRAQLTPQTIRTITGSNTISSDGDALTVTYREA